MLLEALIGVLIFSIGIIAMLGLQASAVSNMSESKWRGAASFLANRIIAQAWNDANIPGNLTPANYDYDPGTGESAPVASRPAPLQAWFNEIQESIPGQRGTSGNFAVANTAPITVLIPCVVGSVAAGCPQPLTGLAAGTTYGNILRVTVRWRLNASGTVRQHQTATYISMN